MTPAPAPSRFHCAQCKTLLVDVREPDGSIRNGCTACEKLVLVDVVRGIWEVRR